MFLWLLRFHLRQAFSARTLALAAAILLLSLFVHGAVASLADPGMQGGYRLSVSLVDPEDSLVSRSIAALLGGLRDVKRVYRESMGQAQARLEQNEILLIVEFAPGFFEKSQTLERRPPVTLWLNPRMPAETALFVRALLGIADSIAGTQAVYTAYALAIAPLYPDADAYGRQLEKSFSRVIAWALGRRGVLTVDYDARLNTSRHLFASMLCLLCMQAGLLLLVQADQDSASGVNTRLALSRAPWFLSPLARGLAGMLLSGPALVPLFVSAAAFNPLLRPAPALAALFLLYAASAALCQAAALAAPGNAMALPGAWLTLLALLLLGGCIYPEALLPEILRKLMPLSPAYHAYRGVYAALGGFPLPGESLGGLLILAGASAALLWMAVRLMPGRTLERGAL